MPVTEVIEVIDVATLSPIGGQVGDGPYRGAVTSAAAEGWVPLGTDDLRELWLVAPAGPATWRSANVEVVWRLVLIVDGAAAASVDLEIAD